MCVGVVALIIKCLACCVSRSITASVGVYCYPHYITPRNNSINIDFTTLIPTTTDTEIDTGLKYGGKTLYAQRFTGTISLLANKRVTKDLSTALSDDPYIISTIGWTRPGASNTANTNSIGVYGADGPTFNGYVDVVGVPGTNTIQLRWLYNVSNTGHYDITAYYTKGS